MASSQVIREFSPELFTAAFLDVAHTAAPNDIAERERAGEREPNASPGDKSGHPRTTRQSRFRFQGRRSSNENWSGGPFTAEKARRAAEEAKHNTSRGGDPQHEKVVHRNAATVAELIQLYLSEGRVDKPNKRDLLLHVHPILGATPINALTTPDISRWQRDVAAFKTARVKKLGFRKKSVTRGGPKVVGRATRTLSAMLNWAIKRELIKDNPAARVAKPADVMRERFLTDEEAVHFFATLVGWRGRAD